MRTTHVLLLAALGAPTPSRGAEALLPLPEAPVRLVIPDVAAFDAALTGAFRDVLTGTPAESDPVVTAWRKTQVGTKLEDQWTRLSGDLPWTWDEVRSLGARSLGLALLDVGHLDAVLVLDTPLAALPVTLPAGTPGTHAGVAYSLVARGAADGSEDTDRRMGLAWARAGGRLFLATSERALTLALDESLAGRGVAPFLTGLASLELDLAALRKDRYFRREFPFPPGPEEGRLRAALRLEDGRLVEVREGTGEPRAGGAVFDAPGAAASGWEPDGAALGAALRSALLEPIPVPLDSPVPALAPLPTAAATSHDRYLVNFETPPRASGAAWEEGELSAWRALLEAQPVAGWGYVLTADGSRRIVFAWPEAKDGDLLGLLRATAERRVGRAAVAAVGDAKEIRVGPDLQALAMRRTGGFVWIGPTAKDLDDAVAPRPSADLVRWARVDLDAVRGEAARWAKAEGPASPEQVRPLSDRVLGLLGWMPATKTFSLERRKTEAGWVERVIFEGR